VASRILTLALVALSALGVGACGDDDDPSSDGGADDDGQSVDGENVQVSDAWARSSPAGVTDGAAYMTLESAVDDQLVGASVPTDVAAAVQLHETVAGDEGAAITMQHVSVVELPANETVAFEPGGLHMMLLDIAGPLESGSSFELTLTFATAEPETVTVDIRDEAP
jgi:copper(I)-binding protein